MYSEQSSPVDEWLRVHRQLLATETAFTDLAIKAAGGEVPFEELQRRREELMALRALCTSVYEKAFPPRTP